MGSLTEVVNLPLVRQKYFSTFLFSLLILGTLSSAAQQGPPGAAKLPAGVVFPDPKLQGGDFQVLYNAETKPQAFKARDCIPYINKKGNPATFSYGIDDSFPCYFTKDTQCKDVDVNGPLMVMYSRVLRIRAPVDPGPAILCYKYK
ncbi:hypothetical protein BCR42DRAFT_397845 [Absidia repens]|uniref:Uncharacterized protein n=1 Tax=Absidia repens TaxID=90262 RepID=A0A1X2HZM2_9FUNG|nr:hypothetical protein BCR42DRAFT_397845 [Absidia repens]